MLIDTDVPGFGVPLTVIAALAVKPLHELAVQTCCV